jgi:hypothetical protein
MEGGKKVWPRIDVWWSGYIYCFSSFGIEKKVISRQKDIPTRLSKPGYALYYTTEKSTT